MQELSKLLKLKSLIGSDKINKFFGAELGLNIQKYLKGDKSVMTETRRKNISAKLGTTVNKISW